MTTLALIDFQQEDVDKLHTKRSRLIGNDPGTGKTYEGIAIDLLNRAGVGHPSVDLKALFGPNKAMKTLVIAPKSVLSVWDDHLMELTDEDIYLYSYHTRHTWMKQVMDPKRSGYFIVNWDSLRVKELRPLSKVYWLNIIADECHRGKNRKAQTTLALWKLQTVYKTAMSGTPADNKPQDLWATLHWLWPKYYTSYWDFVNTYVEVEETDEGYRKLGAPNPRTIKFLHKEMEPWFVRRRKKDVLKNLPDKYYSRRWVDLDPKQRKAYDQMKKTMIAWVDQHHDEIERQDPVIAQAAIAQLTRLQQYANGYVVPRLDKDGNEVWRLVHKGHRSPRGLTLSFPSIPETCTDRCIWKQQFDVTDPSAKLDSLMEMLEDRPNDQIIIWSQFRTVVDLLEARLRKADIPYGLLTGKVKGPDRGDAVAAFQRGDSRVFAGTIAAGGVGITLTASSTVVFLDRSWSPAINTQAEDRAHRIGQTEAVEIIDFMARNTVDLGKAQQLSMKHKWLAMLLGDEVPLEQIVNDIDMTTLLKDEYADTESEPDAEEDEEA